MLGRGSVTVTDLGGCIAVVLPGTNAMKTYEAKGVAAGRGAGSGHKVFICGGAEKADDATYSAEQAKRGEWTR